MKTLTTSLAAAALICSTQLLPADTIVLKNGDTIEGRILRETDKEYVLEVNVTETIRDEKSIPKEDVESIEKVGDDVKAFKKIEELTPTPELLEPEGYKARIETVEAFIEAYPQSTKTAEATEMLETLKAELEIVGNGGIKFGGEVITPDTYGANAYEYDAAIAKKRIKDDVGRRDLIGALRSFTKYEENFSNASDRDEVVTLIKQVLSAYQTSIDESLASFDSRMEKRTTGLSRMSPEDRAQTQRALAEQDERVKARYDAEKQSPNEWVTPDAFLKESLDEARRQADTLKSRLETAFSTGTTIETPVEETYRMTWEQVTEGTEQEKNALVEQARSKGVPEQYLMKLRERAGIEGP